MITLWRQEHTVTSHITVWRHEYSPLDSSKTFSNQRKAPNPHTDADDVTQLSQKEHVFSFVFTNCHRQEPNRKMRTSHRKAISLPENHYSFYAENSDGLVASVSYYDKREIAGDLSLLWLCGTHRGTSRCRLIRQGFEAHRMCVTLKSKYVPTNSWFMWVRSWRQWFQRQI